MIDEVRGLLDQYAQWVRDKSILREVNDQYFEITTPYLDRHNELHDICFTPNVKFTDRNGQRCLFSGATHPFSPVGLR